MLYASDWPHWDFDAPSSITKLPFLNEQAKRNILGLNAARLFDLDAAGQAGKKAPAAAGRGPGRRRRVAAKDEIADCVAAFCAGR